MYVSAEGNKVQGLYIECRSLNGKTLLSWDLAHHIYARGRQGKIAVVTDKPTELLSATKKQWMKLMRQVQRERSSTINAIRVGELTRQIAWMQNLSFSSKPPDDLLEADVTFAPVYDFMAAPPECSTLYATYAFEKEKLYIVTGWMPKGSVVVVYE